VNKLYLVNHDVYKTSVRLEKLFNYLKSNWAIFGYLKIGLMPPKIGSGLEMFCKN
jgi:hypothetical protein